MPPALSLRTRSLPNPNFDGWYVQASWVITGEAKKYRPERGAYGLPQPKDPFSIDRAGWGASAVCCWGQKGTSLLPSVITN